MNVPSIEGYNKDGLVINFDFKRTSNNPDVTVTMNATNQGNNEITDFVFQAAVPKAFQLTLHSPSGSSIPAFGMGAVTQSMLIKNPNKVRPAIVCRSYALNQQLLQGRQTC